MPLTVPDTLVIFTKSPACAPCPGSLTVTVDDVFVVVKALATAVFVRRIGVTSLYAPPDEFCM